jgi:fructose-bisphosphate aldolase class II
MPLVNLNTLLYPAKQGNYAVGAFNIVDLTTLHAVMDAAEELKSPVILNVAEVHLKYCVLSELARAAIARVGNSHIPAVLHLDHGLTAPVIDQAISSGFTSVMIDASLQPYGENLAVTSSVVVKAHALGVTVEGELGHVGGGEGDILGSEVDQTSFTDPREALAFVEQTGVDALAVAFGSVHGPYRAEPKLDIERLSKISSLVGVPLVLHGGSGIPDQEIRKAIINGIAKINVFTEINMAGLMFIKETLSPEPIPVSYPQLLRECAIAMKKVVMEKMTLFGSVGRAGDCLG